MYQLLIVDDQPDLVEDLATMLPWESIGIGAVFQAGSGTEALDVMKETPIDIVISDIRMPGLSGLDLIETIRATWSHVKCILLSGYNDFEYAQRALKSQASDYLLKPVEDEELLQAVRSAIAALESRWLEVSSHQGAIATLKDNLPIVRSHLLAALLKGRRYYGAEWEKKLGMLHLALPAESPMSMMLLRMEDYFASQNETDSSLFQYAICNIAEEIFADGFKLWNMMDDYGYCVFLILPSDGCSRLEMTVIEQKMSHLQHYVKLYLKGTISLAASKQVRFPDDIAVIYEQLLGSFRQRIGGERDFFYTLAEENGSSEASSLSQLYQPPLLHHLLEAGQWEATETKLEAIFAELEQKWGDSHEHILETYYSVVSSLSYSIHKNKLWMADIMGAEFNQLLGGPHFHTIRQLKEWTAEVVGSYRGNVAGRAQDSRSGIIKKVQEYASSRLDTASLQSIAENVYLNPSYLSKVYKLETGEGISDYLSRLKMEKAAHMLRSSQEKIYEIAAMVGYQKTSYFIKVFKERYGVTPQEFRDS
ncbi:response regulator [Paenibacillus sp. LHD-117]|uniref:response regulator transcription factor n=1 Tax=Paenibacillus sp. LHD-117 TaxID=3071412 RepID=UPI0027E00F0C|nr:response regulator [Paenibacillus sp. LHD-117]MDQ6418721.1 response regulator [Paenibacillus sp. LHD-117]